MWWWWDGASFTCCLCSHSTPNPMRARACYVIHFRTQKSAEWKLLCLFTPLYPLPPPMCTYYTNFSRERKNFMFNFFFVCSTSCRRTLFLFACAPLFGTHTIFLFCISIVHTEKLLWFWGWRWWGGLRQRQSESLYLTIKVIPSESWITSFWWH